MDFSLLVLVYLLPVGLIWLVFTGLANWRSKRAKAILEDNRNAGLADPPSLHPIIDQARCLGCGACVHACPEKSVLAIIDGKSALVEPASCVGHGACQAACPTDAIELVFGTETRGVDIPVLTPEFETSAPGIFIAGELGGMGLIRNAIEQGRRAIAIIARRVRQAPAAGSDVLDVVIIGCGPAGISASLGAIEQNLSFVTLDQSRLGGTVAHFPRGKLVMTAPAILPLVGEVHFREVSKEDLLAFWVDVIGKSGFQPRFEEQVTAIVRKGEFFDVTSSKGSYRSRTVLLAIGRRGTPRRLNVPGEQRTKVVYRLVDPEQYAGQHVLVVGGGDSALEAAWRLAEQPDTDVTLSYRGDAYSRARSKNRDAVRTMVTRGLLREELYSNVLSIDEDSVTLDCIGGVRKIHNDSVIICAGGLLPKAFLNDIGIQVETKFGTA